MSQYHVCAVYISAMSSLKNNPMYLLDLDCRDFGITIPTTSTCMFREWMT